MDKARMEKAELRRWVIVASLIGGVIASRLAAQALIDRTFTDVSTATRLFLETLVVAAMFAVATWWLLIVAMRRRHPSVVSSRHHEHGREPRRYPDVVALTSVPGSPTAGRHLRLVPALRAIDR